MLINRHQTAAPVNQEQNRIGMHQGCLGLFTHTAFDTFIKAFFKTCRINDAHALMEHAAFGLSPVARHTRRIIDDRQLLTRKPVKER